MKNYVIYVDEKPYQGEDPENTYATNKDAWSSNSFHTTHYDLNVLLFGGEGQAPKIITGNRGLKNAIEMILRRVEDKCLDFTTIEIKAHP